MPIQRLRRRILDRMVLRPSRHSIESPAQRRETIRCCGRLLECFVQQHPGDDDTPQVLVIKFPGTSGRAEQSTGMPLTLLPGVRGTTWTWNPPGYGGSSGRASLPLMAATAVELVRHVIARQADDQTTIWLSGNSLGCATALAVAAATELPTGRSGIVLRNPPPITDVVKQIARRYPLGHLMDRVAHSLHDSMNVLVTASQVELPAVFLQSGDDTLVPTPLQDQVIEAYAGPHERVVLDGLSHDGITSDQHDESIRQSLHWLLANTGYHCRSGHAGP